MRFLVINGPNLNLLGTREPEVYGSATLQDLEGQWRHHASKLGVGVAAFQSNHEGAIIDELHTAGFRHDGIVINAGAYTHTSYAIHDALVAIDRPTVEVHISNIHEREPWRATSVLAPATIRMIAGRGTRGYLDAIDLLHCQVSSPSRLLAYGDDDDQVVDMRIPDDPIGVVVLVHGGFWRHVWGRDLMDPLAVALTSRGFITANVEYRRGPDSFERSTADISAAVDAVIADLRDVDAPTLPLSLLGHSAGGYLAAREAAAREDAGGDIPAVLLAPVLDLDAISAARPDDDPVSAYLGGTVDAIPGVWERARIAQVPNRVTIIHGADDDDVPIDRTVRDSDGAPIAVLDMDGVGHMELIDPRHDAFDHIVAGVTRVDP